MYKLMDLDSLGNVLGSVAGKTETGVASDPTKLTHSDRAGFFTGDFF